MGRSIVAVIAGMFLGGVVIGITELIGHVMFPLPAGVDLENLDHHDLSWGNLIAVLVAWGCGALTAGVAATWIAEIKRYRYGIIAAWPLMLSSVAMVNMIPSPTWFAVIGVGLYLPVSTCGAWLICRTYDRS